MARATMQFVNCLILETNVKVDVETNGKDNRGYQQSGSISRNLP